MMFQVQNESKDAYGSSRDTANALFKRGKYKEGLQIFKDAFEERMRYFGSDQHKMYQAKQDFDHALTMVRDKAMARIKSGEYYEGFQMSKNVFENRYNYFGSDEHIMYRARQDFHYALTMVKDIAMERIKRGEYSEAFQVSKDVFESRNKYFGSDEHIMYRAKQDFDYVSAIVKR